ncbi:hypothetical protein [Pseudomonas putida]|uniref:hypothetical protein n=1 Tax=Pseudomonas putida TaxID=303 RepID=UPI00265812AA|nr:hypothetical protein [Pseudomonas putida]MCZ9638572.1 hypothetical protein [Pseudomonas putida]
MGTKIISQSLAPWNTKIAPPVANGLVGWFNFDTDVSRFNFNRAIDGVNASLIGSPTLGNGFGTFTSLSAYLQTDISETDEMTIIALCKSNGIIPGGASAGGDASTPAFVTNYIGQAVTPGYTGNALGLGIFATSPTVLTGFASRDNGSGGVTVAGASAMPEVIANWGIRGVRVTNALTTVFNRTLGIEAGSTVNNKRVRNNKKIMIGSTTTAFGGKADISTVAIYQRALSNEEIDKIAAFMRIRAARFGISA